MLGVMIFAALVVANQMYLFVYEDMTFRQMYSEVKSTKGRDIRQDMNMMTHMLGHSEPESDVPKDKPKSCVMTISALNNFGFVWNIYDSIVQHSPSVDCFVWFVGDASIPPDENTAKGWEEIRALISAWDNFEIVSMDEIHQAMPEFHPYEIAFKFNLVELQTTIKPFAFLYCFKMFNADQVMFLDNDIWVTDSLEQIQYELTHRSAVVTPHAITPIPEDGKKQRDKNILNSGIFNFGFAGFKNTPSAHNFLRFWGERLNYYGFVKPDQAMFYDQNWGVFIPVLFDHDDYIVLRDFRYNIAYWNLHETGPGLSMKDKIPMMRNPVTNIDERVVFMHFSGMSLLEEYDMDGISRHQNRFTLRDFPRIGEVLITYMKLVEAHKTIHFRYFTFGYNHFNDGGKIWFWMREIYAAAIFPVGFGNVIEYDEEPPYKVWLSPWLRVDYADRVNPDPFCAEYDCLVDKSKMTFLDWFFEVHPTQIVNMEGKFFSTSLEHQVWKTRIDIQAVYPDPLGDDYGEFKSWYIMAAHKEHQKDIVDPNLHSRWSKKIKYHQENALKFHKRVDLHDTDVGINVIGWHCGHWGVAISGAKIIRSALSQDIPVNAIHSSVLPDKKFTMPKDMDFPLTRSTSEPVNLAVINAPETNLLKSEYPGVIWKHKYNIGYWAWELDVFPSNWMNHAKHYDEIWAPSSFVKRAIESSPMYEGVTVKVLPIPLAPHDIVSVDNTLIESDDLRSLIKKHEENKPFVFLTSFDYDSFVERKNPKAAIRTFIEAFGETDENVLLIVKSHGGTLKDIKKLRSVSNDDHRVVFLNENLSDHDTLVLKNFQDCFLSLHRSEGYGLNILESMGRGVPTITTNYSGNVEFFKPVKLFLEKCHFPAPYKMIKLNKSLGPYEEGNRWANVDELYVVKAMRQVIQNNCKELHGTKMSELVFEEFGYENVGRLIKEYLAESLPAIVEKQNAEEKDSAPALIAVEEDDYWGDNDDQDDRHNKEVSQLFPEIGDLDDDDDEIDDDGFGFDNSLKNGDNGEPNL